MTIAGRSIRTVMTRQSTTVSAASRLAVWVIAVRAPGRLQLDDVGPCGVVRQQTSTIED